MSKYIYTLIFILLFSACSTTKYIKEPIEVEKVRTEYITNYELDTIYERDSIDRYIKNDTVIIYKEKIRNRYISKVDTIVRVDSIPYTVENTITIIEEVNILKWYQKVLMCLGLITLGILGYILYKKVGLKIVNIFKIWKIF